LIQASEMPRKAASTVEPVLIRSVLTNALGIRGLFRLWTVGSVLFVIAVAFVSYRDIKEQSDEPKTLATSVGLADWVHQRFYSDMPREQFDKKITLRSL